MAPVVLRHGFRKVAGIDEYFRASALEKGQKLCAAKYAYDVEETLEWFDGDSQVAAKCHSQVRQATYDVNIQLSSQRRKLGAQCTCKAGLGGGCKHVAAVVLFVNEADVPSSTDRPQGWHKERSVRISSSIAHRILTRQKAFESLAEQLQNSKTPLVPALMYGTAIEPTARATFEKKIGAKVTQVGVVIHPCQPWLCASPDGLFQTTSGVILLEIKCPYSRKDDIIIDHALCESYVSYVTYHDGMLQLSRSHPYYTQVQVAMYFTNTTECFFFVYTSKQDITIVVDRDEDFLARNIPLLEAFYYSYYIKQLMR
nr:uncharacterized protein LOC126517661 [Dermacentor andersoni]